MRADDFNLGVGLGQEVHRAHLAANLLITGLQIAQRNVAAQMRAVDLRCQPAAIGRQFHRRADVHEMAARRDAGLGVHGFDADQMPTGFMISAPHSRDLAVLAAGLAIEQIVRG